MKLSEAILLSIGVVRNERYQYLSLTDYDGIPGVCGCAIGTALYSMGVRRRLSSEPGGIGNYFREIERLWPWAKNGDIPFEISRRHACGESRESIAKWIASIEPQEGNQVEQLTQEVSNEVQYAVK